MNKVKNKLKSKKLHKKKSFSRSKKNRKRSLSKRKNTLKKKIKSRKKRRDGMDRIYKGITGLAESAIDITNKEIPYFIPSFSVEGSYNWYMSHVIGSYEIKINYIKRLIKDILTKEAGKPTYDRIWSDDDLSKFIEILRRPEYNNIKITGELLDKVILKKDEELINLTIEEYDMLHEKYPVAKCGNIGQYYKVKDGFNENLILVKIIDYDTRNRKCIVKDVFTDIEASIDPDILEKRAKDLTYEETREINNKVLPLSSKKSFFVFAGKYAIDDAKII